MYSAQFLSRLTLGVVSSTTATSASAAIVVFDINPEFFTGTSGYTNTRYFGDLNFSTGTFLPGASSFSLFNDYTTANFASGNVSAARNSGTGFSVALLLSAGDTVGNSLESSFGNVFINFEKSVAPVGIHYFALLASIDGATHFGWLEFRATDAVFEDDPTGTYNDLTFTRFAFNDIAGQSIVAGQTPAIPEASTLGFVGGLFGLVTAAHLRRRKLKQAAASDKFLALAAGEKLN